MSVPRASCTYCLGSLPCFCSYTVRGTRLSPEDRDALKAVAEFEWRKPVPRG